MEQRMITFYGDSFDQYGMPIPFHSYSVTVSAWIKENTFLISFASVTEDAKLPNPRQLIVKVGNQEEAFSNAIEILRKLPNNSNLNVH